MKIKRSRALKALQVAAMCALTIAAVAASFPRAATIQDGRVSALQNTVTIPPSPADTAMLEAFRANIDHIVFIIKENRSFDNLFGTFPGADGATSGVISTGEPMPLQHTPDRTSRDLGHEWRDTHLAIDDGKMDQFDLVTGGNVNGDFLSMSQVLDYDIPNYWRYAESFVLADRMFSALAGPSFPNHLYTVAAQSGGVISNPNSLSWGCDAAPNVTAMVMDISGNTTQQFPCFEMPTVADELETAGVPWRFYAPQKGQPGYIWSTLNAIGHIRLGPLWTTRVMNDDQFLADATSTLPSVSWLVPDFAVSDHPTHPLPGGPSTVSMCEGENWTVQHINAIMQGPNWPTTVIIL